MSLGYAWEVFYTGTRSLACGTGSVQQRVENAFYYMGCRIGGPNLVLPPDLAARANDLMKRVTCVPAVGDEGTLAATCRAMSDEEAVGVAKEVFEVFNEVSQQYGASGRP